MNNMLSAMARDREILLKGQQAKRNSLERAVAKRTQALQALNEKIEVLATRDSLTDTLNRGSFFDTAQHLLVLCQRENHPHLLF
jgi:predicted signal transduction protein with EAL and GGDEF domain